MILTVTPNPALDVTYRVDALVPGASHRVHDVREVAGGKGLNVASVLRSRGIPVIAAGVVGGGTGDRVLADLDARGIAHEFLRGRHETRRTTTVVSADSGGATAFNEAGTPWDDADWGLLVDHVRRLLATVRPSVLVASGSAPPGIPRDGYAQLTALGRAAGCRVVVDASGEVLLGALSGHPDVVKPNLDELRAVTGTSDPVAGARALQEQGARQVVVSLGEAGLAAVSPEGVVTRARLGTALRGNPTGAGDAAVAAIAAGLAEGTDWQPLLVEAVAWSAAAVLQPVAGSLDAHDIDRLRAAVRTTAEPAG